MLENVFAYMVLPEAAYKLPSRRIRHIGAAFDELHAYFREMIAERRASGMDPRESDIGRRDLLGALVHANAPAADRSDEEREPAAKSKATLDDSEVMGNLYILLLAGHDTTAHTLAFCFALLALYPDVQRRPVEHIEAVCPGGREPVRRRRGIGLRPQTFDDFPRLTYVLAIFLETLRLFPSVAVIPRYCVADSPVPVVRQPDGQRETVLIPAGGEVFVDAVALHYNRASVWAELADTTAHHWPDPHAFKPERFLDDGAYRWPREAFMGFSAGARTCVDREPNRADDDASCLGQKFAQVEAVAIIALLVRRYEFRLREDVDGTAPTGESLEQKRERICRAKTVITLTPAAKVPFLLVPR